MAIINIGFDAKRAFNNHTGLGVYSRDLIKYLLSSQTNLNLILFSPKVKIEFIDNLNYSKFKIINSRLGSLWRSLLIYIDIKKEAVNIYHGLAGELPIFIPRNTKKIVTIHDLLFLRFPLDYSFIDRISYNLKAKYACKIADKIIAVSEATKTDIIDFYKTDSEKIIVIPNTINSEEIIKPSNRLYPKKYLLCISSFLKRKNQELLVRSFINIANQSDVDLIYIGKGKELKYVQKIAKNSKFVDRIAFIKNVTESDKSNYLTNAEFTIYPSLYEGFGIPILESFLYEKLVLVLKNKVNYELASEAGIYFENNLEDLSQKILATLNISNEDKKELLSKSKLQLDKYNPEKVYPKLTTLYRDLLDN